MSVLKNKVYQAVVILAILVLFSSSYIIREGQQGILLTFGKISQVHSEPGLYFKAPWPISEVKNYDTRSKILSGNEEQVLTKDQNTLIVKTHLVWKIVDLVKFWKRVGSENKFESHLNDLLRSKQNALFGMTEFKDIFTKSVGGHSYLETLEKKLTSNLGKNCLELYGVKILFSGFDKIRLPVSVMDKVYEKMISEREQISESLKAEGVAQAKIIRSNAKAIYDQKLAKIQGRVKEIIGEAESKSIDAYKVFSENPKLALGLKKIESLNSLLRDRSTVILDTSVAPLDILRSTSVGEF